MRIISSTKTLSLKLTAWEKIFSFHGDFSITKKNLVAIKEGRPPLFIFWWDLRFPGTFIPGLVRLGTYFTKRGKEFWLWKRGKRYEYTIELKDEKYNRLVISSDKHLGLNK